jgi:hypothetical protein
MSTHVPKRKRSPSTTPTPSTKKSVGPSAKELGKKIAEVKSSLRQREITLAELKRKIEVFKNIIHHQSEVIAGLDGENSIWYCVIVY